MHTLHIYYSADDNNIIITQNRDSSVICLVFADSGNVTTKSENGESSGFLFMSL